jgi:hypothetical protein
LSMSELAIWHQWRIPRLVTGRPMCFEVSSS